MVAGGRLWWLVRCFRSDLFSVHAFSLRVVLYALNAFSGYYKVWSTFVIKFGTMELFILILYISTNNPPLALLLCCDNIRDCSIITHILQLSYHTNNGFLGQAWRSTNYGKYLRLCLVKLCKKWPSFTGSGLDSLWTADKGSVSEVTQASSGYHDMLLDHIVSPTKINQSTSL